MKTLAFFRIDAFGIPQLKLRFSSRRNFCFLIIIFTSSQKIKSSKMREIKLHSQLKWNKNYLLHLSLPHFPTPSSRVMSTHLTLTQMQTRFGLFNDLIVPMVLSKLPYCSLNSTPFCLQDPTDFRFNDKRSLTTKLIQWSLSLNGQYLTTYHVVERPFWPEKSPNRFFPNSTLVHSSFHGFPGSMDQQCDCSRRGAGSRSCEKMRQQKALFWD